MFRIAFVALLTQSSALFGKPKTQEEEDALSHDKLSQVTGFAATDALRSIQTNPEVQKKMRDMMKDPEALVELSKLMRDPIFKAQVEAFTANPKVVNQVKKRGAAAYLDDEMRAESRLASADNVRARAAAKAEAELEYEKYSAQFTGDQNAATGLQSLVNAAKDPARLADAMADLNDPEMMISAREMLADPTFQAEMQRMMEQPEMRKIVEASRSFVQEISKDPSKMAEMQQHIAQMTKAGSLHDSDEF